MSNKPKHIPQYDAYAATFVRQPTTGTPVPIQENHMIASERNVRAVRSLYAKLGYTLVLEKDKSVVVSKNDGSRVVKHSNLIAALEMFDSRLKDYLNKLGE